MIKSWLNYPQVFILPCLIRLELRASEAIKEGGEIVNQYVKPNSGTVSRRLILKNKWHFECDCRRCKDPTEFGSLLSALTCEKVI